MIGLAFRPGQEKANRIGMSASKPYALIAARAIACSPVGGKIVLSVSDVDARLQSRRVGAAEPIPAAPRVRVKLTHISLPWSVAT